MLVSDTRLNNLIPSSQSAGSPLMAHSGLFSPPHSMSVFRGKADAFSRSLTCPLMTQSRQLKPSTIQGTPPNESPAPQRRAPAKRWSLTRVFAKEPHGRKSDYPRASTTLPRL
jgi:hypothetical protein